MEEEKGLPECLCPSISVPRVSSSKASGTRASMRTKTLISDMWSASDVLFIKIRLYCEIGLGSLCGGRRREGVNWGWRGEGEGQAAQGGFVAG